jgi:glycosyltransferase involved in cell wall biosynthesis
VRGVGAADEFRVHRGLRDLGIASTLHPGHKRGDDPEIVPAWPLVAGRFRSNLAAWLDMRSLDAYPNRRGDVFSPVRFCYGRPHRDLVAAADVICLHWIAGSFLHPSDLMRLGKPLTWLLHDLWPFTGGCHFPGSCRAFEQRCGRCPSLGSNAPDDFAGRDFAARERAYEALDLTIVAPSRWIADEARRSALFGRRRIEHIANGIDLQLYRPMDRGAARRLLALPADERPVLLFGAMSATSNARKGYGPLQKALRVFARTAAGHGAMAVVFGGETHENRDIDGLRVVHVEGNNRRGEARVPLRRRRRRDRAVHGGQSSQRHPGGARLRDPGSSRSRRAAFPMRSTISATAISLPSAPPTSSPAASNGSSIRPAKRDLPRPRGTPRSAASTCASAQGATATCSPS